MVQNYVYKSIGICYNELFSCLHTYPYKLIMIPQVPSTQPSHNLSAKAIKDSPTASKFSLPKEPSAKAISPTASKFSLPKEPSAKAISPTASKFSLPKEPSAKAIEDSPLDFNPSKPKATYFGTNTSGPRSNPFGKPKSDTGESSFGSGKPSAGVFKSGSSFGFGTVSTSIPEHISPFGKPKSDTGESSFGSGKPAAGLFGGSSAVSKSSFEHINTSKPLPGHTDFSIPASLTAPVDTSSLNGPLTLKPPPGAWPDSNMFVFPPSGSAATDTSSLNGPFTFNPPPGAWPDSNMFVFPPSSSDVTGTASLGSGTVSSSAPAPSFGMPGYFSSVIASGPSPSFGMPTGYTEVNGPSGKRYVATDPELLPNGFYVYDNGDTLRKDPDGSVFRYYQEGFSIATDPDGNSIKRTTFVNTPISKEHIPTMVGFPMKKQPYY
jgi:hypothetical protein